MRSELLVLFAALAASAAQAQEKMPASPPVRVERTELPTRALGSAPPADTPEPGSGSSPEPARKPTTAEERVFRDFEAWQRREKLEADKHQKQKLEDEKLFRDFQKSQRRPG